MSSPALHLRATVLPYEETPRDLWIVDGKLRFNGPPWAEELAPPGGFVSPGLVDSHTHLYFVNQPLSISRPHIDENRRRHLGCGVLLLRDMGAVSDEVVGLPEDDGLPLVQAAGRCLVIEPKAPFTVTEPRHLAERVAGQARGGAAWVKIFADWPGWPGGQEEPPFGDDPLSYPEQTLGEAVEAAHREGTRVATHAFGREGAQAAIAAGVDSIEHGWGLDEKMLAEMARRRIAWTPMLAIATPMLRGALREGNDVQSTWIRASQQRMRALLPLAQRLGVPILAGSDWFPAVTLADEVAELHRLGLSPTEALAAASSAARAFLGAPGLDEGAPADLVLFEHDPRRSLDALRSPSLVMLRGRLAETSPRAAFWDALMNAGRSEVAEVAEVADLADLPDLSSEIALTAAQVAAYRSDGYAVIRGAARSEEIRPFQPLVEAQWSLHKLDRRPMQERDTYGRAFTQALNLGNHDPRILHLSRARRFAKLAADLMGADSIRVFLDEAFFKEPGAGSTPWHQDQTTFPFHAERALTMWIPLMDVGRELGILRFARGSHRDGQIGPDDISDDSDRELGRLVAERGFEVFHCGHLEVGDLTAHDGWTIHSATANQTDTCRQVYSIHYFTDGARVFEPDNASRRRILQFFAPELRAGDLAAGASWPVVFSRQATTENPSGGS